VAPARRLEIVAGDLADAPSLGAAVRGADTVVHCAARVSATTDGARDTFEFNVRATEAVARATRTAGAKRFLHLSSGGVYGDGRTGIAHREADAPNPGTAYEHSKLAAEKSVRCELDDSRVDYVILRPAGMFGPGRQATLAFFDEIRRRRLWVHGSPNVIVHPTHVSDVAQACMKMLNLDRWTERVVNIAGERALRYQDFIALAASVVGVRARQFVIPAPVGRPIALTAASALRLARLRVPEAIDRAGRAYINRALDISLARRVLGYEPAALEGALRQAAEASARSR
jgi:nucleoside-diphosphate-sugar epimerase